MDRDHTQTGPVVGGIDTHKDLHTAAVVDETGTTLGSECFSTTRAGYRALIRWMREFGDLARVGVEGTGSYGAGVMRHLQDADIEVLEVSRPDRVDRRSRGKSDTFDAEAAARAALDRRRTSTPKAKSGPVEALRVLRLTRKTAVGARTKALQLLRSHIVSAPNEIRDQVRNLTRMQLIRTCAAWRPDPGGFHDPAGATRISLRSLARRIIKLNDEIGELDELISPLVQEIGRDRLQTRDGQTWLREEAWPWLSSEQRALVEGHQELIDQLTEQIDELDGRIRTRAAEHPGAELLQTIPGIGPYRSLLLVAEVTPIERFPSPAELVAFAGLAPSVEQSGVGEAKYGPIPDGANRWVRGVLVSTIPSHMQATPDSALGEFYRRKKNQLGMPVARVAAARKLCRAIHAMLSTGEVWRG